MFARQCKTKNFLKKYKFGLPYMSKRDYTVAFQIHFISLDGNKNKNTTCKNRAFELQYFRVIEKRSDSLVYMKGEQVMMPSG